MLATFALLLGCIGQSVFYPQQPWGLPRWVSTAFFMMPWVVIFLVNLGRVSPLRLKVHYRTCLGAMCWWAVLTVTTLILLSTAAIPRPDGSARMFAGLVLMNIGWLGFIPIWHLRRQWLATRS